MSRLATYRAVRFRLDHLDCMEVREHERMTLTPEMLEYAQASAEAYTVVYDGRIVACLGAFLSGDGRAELWQIPSVHVNKYLVRYARYGKEWLDQLQKEYKIKRMETVSLDDELHNRWMTFLGFEREGVKRKYIGDNDYVMWGRLWE